MGVYQVKTIGGKDIKAAIDAGEKLRVISID